MISENKEILDIKDFKEENQRNTQSKVRKNLNLNSFNFTIKNSISKDLSNYYTITIKNEIEILSINAHNKNDEKLIYMAKYNLEDLHNFSNSHIAEANTISEVYLFLQNLILLGNKAQITMEMSEEIISLIIKKINESNKIVFNLKKNKIAKNENCLNDSDKKSSSEIDEHVHDGTDLTSKNYPPLDSKDMSNSVSSKDKDKEIKNNSNLLGKKRNSENSMDNFIEIENDNTNNIINEKGAKNEENEYLDLAKDLYGNPKEKLFHNNHSSDDSNNEALKENNKTENLICKKNEIQSKEDNITNKNINKISQKQINTNNEICSENDNNNSQSNQSNDPNEENEEYENDSNDEEEVQKNKNKNNNINLGINANNGNGKKRQIFSVQTDKYVPNNDLEQNKKFGQFLVIRNGMYPKSFLQNYSQFFEGRRRRRKGEKVEEDEEEFKVYTAFKPEEENIIRISTPMKLRAKTEYIDLSENENDDSHFSIGLSNDKNNKINFMVENDLLKSQIITKKEQIDLLVE